MNRYTQVTAAPTDVSCNYRKSVIIQDFLMEGSIEERQHDMLQQKNAVADAVIDGQGINAKGGVDLTVGSLIGFLQKARP
jgi:SNF2 family DNA or RNA helicase